MKAVSGKGRMTPDGWQPENHDALDALTETANGQRVGKDPMTIPCEVLTASGHPRQYATSVASRLGDDKPWVKNTKLRLTGVRSAVCAHCAETMAEVRRCPIINCAAWPYRMGRNPHNPRRGINPFKKEGALAAPKTSMSDC